MPTAFDRGTPASDHSPLLNQLSFDPGIPPFDIGAILDQWLDSLQEFVFPAIKQLTGIDLSSPEAFFVSIAQLVANGGTGVLAFIQSLIQPILDLIKSLTGVDLGAITGTLQQILNLVLGGGLGAGPASILGLLNQGLQDIGSLWAQLFGQQASQQAQIDAQASGGFSYDPVANGVSGWSNLVGTLALSSRGAFIQALTQTVAYRSSGLSVDKYGVNFVIDPTMRGVTGAGICADSVGAKWVGLLAYRGFDGDALWLVTAASPTLWVVQKQLDLSGVNRLSGLTTLDLKTDGVNKFSVKLNGQPVTALDWTDGTGIASHNSTHRGVILLANGLNRNEDSFYGPAIRGKVVSYAA